MLVAQLALGIGVLALAVAGCQWYACRKRIDELQAELARTKLPVESANSRAEGAENQAQQSAAAAAASAMAAQASAEAAKSIAELGKRAWVYATEFKLSLKTQSNENSGLDVWIANLGATPARELRLSTNFLICDEAPADLPLKPRANNLVLGPSVGFSLAHFVRISPAEMVSITTGKKVLLTCGQAHYRDVFGTERETRWCARYDATARAFVPTPVHNSAT